jgi:hypothetical protein
MLLQQPLLSLYNSNPLPPRSTTRWYVLSIPFSFTPRLQAPPPWRLISRPGEGPEPVRCSRAFIFHTFHLNFSPALLTIGISSLDLHIVLRLHDCFRHNPHCSIEVRPSPVPCCFLLHTLILAAEITTMPENLGSREDRSRLGDVDLYEEMPGRSSRRWVYGEC